MNILITTRNVYDYAMALTARVGKLSEDYRNVAITEDNYPMLDVYMSSGIVIVESELRRHLSDSNNLDVKLNKESVTISVKDREGRDEAVRNLAESSIRLFLAFYIATEWLRMTPASVLCESYGATAISHLKAAVSALNQRNGSAVGDSDYSLRADDNVLARPGVRIGEMEMITVENPNCFEQRDAAVSCISELLISKP